MEPAAAAPVQRRTRLLTQEEIDETMALERRPFRPPGFELSDRMGQRGAELLEILADANIDMEYKKKMLRQYGAKVDYVEVTDNEGEDDGVDRVREHQMVRD